MPLLHGNVRQLLAERIIPTGIMARSQVTLDIALRWSAEIGRHHDSIDIALRWSARGGKSLK